MQRIKVLLGILLLGSVVYTLGAEVVQEQAQEWAAREKLIQQLNDFNEQNAVILTDEEICEFFSFEQHKFLKSDLTRAVVEQGVKEANEYLNGLISREKKSLKDVSLVTLQEFVQVYKEIAGMERWLKHQKRKGRNV